MSETRWRLTPLDESGLVYFGLDVTNGNQAALFVLYDNEFNEAEIDNYDLLLRETLVGLCFLGFKSSETEIDFKSYHMIPWTDDIDRALVRLIDRLTHMRMTNVQSVSLRLQLEMPI